MKMMALNVSLSGHGHLGMKAAHFYLLTDWHGPRDKICVLPQGAETDLLCVANCAGGGKNNHHRASSQQSSAAAE